MMIRKLDDISASCLLVLVLCEIELKISFFIFFLDILVTCPFIYIKNIESEQTSFQKHFDVFPQDSKVFLLIL